MITVNVGKSPKNRAVLPFYGAGALFFLILTILMFIASDRFQGHFFQAELLALVHIAALGWGTMIIFGASYQLMPVIFEKELYSSNLAFISFCFLLVGCACLVISFWYFKVGLTMIGGGILILLAVSFYCFNVLKTAKSLSFSIQKFFLISSAFWLFITAGIGVLLAINLYTPYIPYNHLEILKLHAHIGFVGWFLQLITGISSILVPMFLFGKSKKEKLLYYAFTFQNIGLIGFAFDQLFLGSSNRALFYSLMIAFGIFFWLAYLRDVYTKRLKKKIDIQMRYTSISIIFLLLTLILIPIILFISGNQWSILYGIFIFFGWISAIIFGKTFKTLPFIIWNMHYKEMHGKKGIPLPKNLYQEQLLYYQFWCFIAALILLSIGIILNYIIIIQVGLILWIIVAILYVFNVAKVFLHKKVI